MQVVFNEEDKVKSNVIYLIEVYVAPYRKKFIYIGLTTRQLKERVNEHLNKGGAVYNFIRNNNIKSIKVNVLWECKYTQCLDAIESLFIGKYILKHGTRANKRNRLLNKDLKGFDKMPLKLIEKCCERLQLIY